MIALIRPIVFAFLTSDAVKNLVVDLLERPRGRQHVLRIIGRVIDDPAELGVRGRRGGGAGQRATHRADAL